MNTTLYGEDFEVQVFNFLKILSYLALQFKVSKEAMLIRLKEDGFISDVRKQPQRISNILKGY